MSDELHVLEEANKLAKGNGYVSLNAPTRSVRMWYVRMAKAVLAERERCARLPFVIFPHDLAQKVPLLPRVSFGGASRWRSAQLPPPSRAMGDDDDD